MSNSYDIGDLITVKAVFRDRNSELADPTTVTLKIKKSDGVISTYVYPSVPVEKDSTGIYHADIDTTAGPGGVWVYRWTGVGVAQAAEEREFVVRTSLV